MANNFLMYGISEPTVYHALVVIFLEFFAWGLLTTPMINVVNETFPNHTFLMNGLIVGIKGFLSFLSAPLIGALSDLWGRKFFLLLTVFFTCIPIPLMRWNTWWYFAMISLSGVFAVTFSVVFAYVADVTNEHDRSAAYGLVSATFAASLVTSPALGAYLSAVYSENLVIFLATFIAVLDVVFILLFVPESLPEKLRLKSISLWETADPFASLRKVGKDRMILMLCIAVFLSYLPEAGQYSCFFVYLRLVMGFSAEDVALFIAVVGLLSVVAQTAMLSMLMKSVGSKNTIIIGLFLEMLQLLWYGFGSQTWMMWTAGIVAALASITYPAISAYVSTYADADKQGLVQGMITGMRGLCNGLGPAVYGFVFTLFNVDLTHNVPLSQLPGGGERGAMVVNDLLMNSSAVQSLNLHENQLIPGPPFVFGAFLVLLAILVTIFIPELIQYPSQHNSNTESAINYSVGRTGTKQSKYFYTSMEYQRKDNQCIGSNANDGKGSPLGSADEDNTSGHSLKSITSPMRKSEDNRFEMHKRGPVSCESQLPLMQDLEPL